MKPKEFRSPIFNRLARVLWFFLCVLGANAAIGVFNHLVDYPNAAFYMQVGFFGGAAALIAMGGLELVEAFVADEMPTVQRLSKASVFVLSLCGGAVALGTYFFALVGDNDGVFLLAYGLLSASAALLVTGMLKLGEAHIMSASSEEEAGR